MAINMEKQFEKLKDTILNANKIFWDEEGEEEYKGPLNPSAIVFLHIEGKNKNVNYLVLAESVPRAYLPSEWAEGLGILLAELDENFNLKNIDENVMTLRGLQLDTTPTGTLKDLLSKKFRDMSMHVLYKKR